ncbi:hypothetical protein [Pseudochrobactrum asaccharolyticum]|uniref:hypothetical protein n=1 Tax=Pseudochrobactrum asaccharolyticum TaxID=354351 RepID=UPI0040432934
MTEANDEQKALAVKAASRKTEAVTIAACLIKGTNWIPAPVRIAPAIVLVDHDAAAFEDSTYPLPQATE